MPPPGTETTAFLIAGRVLDRYVPTVGHVIALRELAARHPGVSVIVAGDENDYGEGPHLPSAALYSDVAIGVVVAEVTADEDLRGPLALAELRAGLEAIAARGALFWRAVARVIGADDITAQADRVHVVPSGPLSYAALAFGVPGPFPEYGEDDGWVGGQRSNQQRPERAIFGEELAAAEMEGRGTTVLDLDAIAARVAAAPADHGLYLIARYD